MPNTDNNGEMMLKELVQIRKLLTILAQDKISDFNATIEKKYLTTEQRRKMYDMFDGTNSYKDIGDGLNVSAEGVRQLAVMLESAGIIEIQGGKTKYPKKLM